MQRHAGVVSEAVPSTSRDNRMSARDNCLHVRSPPPPVTNVHHDQLRARGEECRVGPSADGTLGVIKVDNLGPPIISHWPLLAILVNPERWRLLSCA